MKNILYERKTKFNQFFQTLIFKFQIFKNLSDF